jgi:hypothetical protein
MAESDEPDCACTGIVGFYGPAIDALVKGMFQVNVIVAYDRIKTQSFGLSSDIQGLRVVL